jgi:hypothetical protein
MTGIMLSLNDLVESPSKECNPSVTMKVPPPDYRTRESHLHHFAGIGCGRLSFRKSEER